MAIETLVKSVPVVFGQTDYVLLAQSSDAWKEYPTAKPSTKPPHPPHPHDPPVVPESSTYGAIFVGSMLTIMVYRRYFSQSKRD